MDELRAVMELRKQANDRLAAAMERAEEELKAIEVVVKLLEARHPVESRIGRRSWAEVDQNDVLADVLRAQKRFMTAAEIFDELRNGGMTFADHNNPKDLVYQQLKKNRRELFVSRQENNRRLFGLVEWNTATTAA